MPLRSVGEKLKLPVDTPADAEALFEAGLAIAQNPSHSYRTYAARDLEDHFFYLAALHPELMPQLHLRFAGLTDAQLEHFGFTFSTWLHLLQGANDACIDTILKALQSAPDNFNRRQMLAAIGTPAALSAVAAFAHKFDAVDDFVDLGFWVPSATSPAQPRFMMNRWAIRKVATTKKGMHAPDVRHPVGLPLEAVAVNVAGISWHYLSLDTRVIPGLPPMPGTHLHLVSPPIFIGWTLHSDILFDGRYQARACERDDDDDELDDLLDQAREENEGYGYAELLPFDDELVYCNGHVLSTENVYGVVGGPPIGLYPNPMCVECGRLMFHVATVEDRIRSYGDGFRCLYVCEDCNVAACTGVSWN